MRLSLQRTLYWDKEEVVSILLEPKPFAAGMMRVAILGTVRKCTEGTFNREERVVIKEPKEEMVEHWAEKMDIEVDVKHKVTVIERVYYRFLLILVVRTTWFAVELLTISAKITDKLWHIVDEFSVILKRAVCTITTTSTSTATTFTGTTTGITITTTTGTTITTTTGTTITTTTGTTITTTTAKYLLLFIQYLLLLR